MHNFPGEAMNLFRFDAEIGNHVEKYKSSGFIISRVAHLFDEAVVHCAYLKAGGMIDYHQATTHQLFMVVQGEGWVSDERREQISIRTGQAAFWQKGEWHESGTPTGMIAVILEGNRIEPENPMPPV